MQNKSQSFLGPAIVKTFENWVFHSDVTAIYWLLSFFFLFVLQSQTEKLAKVYQPKRAILATKCTTSVAHLLAARQDLSKIMRTSSGSIREKTVCAINKVPVLFPSYNLIPDKLKLFNSIIDSPWHVWLDSDTFFPSMSTLILFPSQVFLTMLASWERAQK